MAKIKMKESVTLLVREVDVHKQVVCFESKLEYFTGQREHGVEHPASEPYLFHPALPFSFAENRFAPKRFLSSIRYNINCANRRG